jgi:hypothetical protein
VGCADNWPHHVAARPESLEKAGLGGLLMVALLLFACRAL